MNTFVIEDFFVTNDNVCNFYTVRYDNKKVSETEHFYDQYENHSEYSYDFGNIHVLIVEIAKRGIKIINKTRDEAKAFALPPRSVDTTSKIENFENKLRLYYVPISKQIIVLLGGGIAHDEETGKPSIALWEAQTFVKAIEKAKGELFSIVGNKLTPTDNENEIIIY